jgi:HTH-type transcriptional regulator/antitoxin HigA
MKTKPIRNDADHEAALRELERLWGAKEGKPEGDRLDVPTTLVEAHESVAAERSGLRGVDRE